MKPNKYPRVSVIMPCLNEELSIAKSVSWAKIGLRAVKRLGYSGEIIVVDNGSTDRSVSLAKRAGAAVLVAKTKGYGAAYQRGVAHAKGNYIVIGDSDGTYDFRTITPFIKSLQEGAHLVLGSRFLGTIHKGAMPWSHRYIGSPILTFILNITFARNISDAHTGFRAFTKAAYQTWNIKSNGMEFASEMIVKAIYHHSPISQIPISYYPRIGISKLSPLSDAWRHIKFMILYAPSYAFIFPGVLLLSAGGIVSVALLPGGLPLWGRLFDIHSMTIGMFAANLGIQIILLGMLARVHTSHALGSPNGPLMNFLLRQVSFPRLLILGVVLLMIGLLILANIILEWAWGGFGDLSRVRDVLFGVGVATSGVQIIFSSILFGLLKE